MASFASRILQVTFSSSFETRITRLSANRHSEAAKNGDVEKSETNRLRVTNIGPWDHSLLTNGRGGQLRLISPARILWPFLTTRTTKFQGETTHHDSCLESTLANCRLKLDSARGHHDGKAQVAMGHLNSSPHYGNVVVVSFHGTHICVYVGREDILGCLPVLSSLLVTLSVSLPRSTVRNGCA